MVFLRYNIYLFSSSEIQMIFPLVIKFVDSNKIKTIFSLEQLNKHIKSPIVFVTSTSLVDLSGQE